VSEPAFQIPPDNRAPGTGNPAFDVDSLSDMVGLITAVLTQWLGATPSLPIPGGNAANVAVLAAELGGTRRAILSDQVATNTLVLAGAGVPGAGLGQNGDTYLNQSTGQEYAKASGAWGQNGLVYMGQLATTGLTGFTLINGTPTILTWTAPNDGAMHRVMLLGELNVTSAQTGGVVTLNYTSPDGGARNRAVFAGSLGAGYNPIPGIAAAGATVAPNTTVTLTQTAQTAGASVLYMELWGS
jgi:hypothetical protein